jgi:hypothetical protein
MTNPGVSAIRPKRPPGVQEGCWGCEALGALRWITRSGKLRSMALPEEWLTVELAGGLPEPDTSWMDEPWSSDRFTGWLR